MNLSMEQRIKSGRGKVRATISSEGTKKLPWQNRMDDVEAINLIVFQNKKYDTAPIRFPAYMYQASCNIQGNL
jgi:hypothetical protein